MKTEKIGTHSVTYYDAIEELPVTRFHKFQKMQLLDSGIGGDLASFDRRAERLRRYVLTGEKEKAVQELDNLRKCVWLVQEEINPKMLSFAALVVEIDGKRCEDLTDDALREVARLLGDSPTDKLVALFGAAKKKITDDLRLYFPSIFDSSETKEWYGILRQRAVTILRGIQRGEIDRQAIEELSARLATFDAPLVFDGSKGADVMSDKQFETVCLSLSEQLNVNAKRMTVTEYYNAFEFLRNKAQKGAK